MSICRPLFDSVCSPRRQVREECGYDISPYLKADDFVDLVMKEQSVRLYICRGVPEDTKFEPQTRKEISVSATPRAMLLNLI